MSAPTNPADADREPSAVESMLNRPVADVARFAVDVVATWARGLIDPWRLGRTVARGGGGLAPPFAFLVIALFAAGVGMRLWRSIQAVPLSDDRSLLSDFRLALGEVSLMQATLITLPCVLLVAGGARLLSSAYPYRRTSFASDRLVAAACYAVGWQSGLVLLIFAAFVALQMAGYEPSGVLHDEVEAVLPWLVLWALTWGVLIVAPSIRDRLPVRWWSTPASLLASTVALAVMLGGGMTALQASSDLTTVERLRMKRQYDLLFGDLQVNVLETRPISGDDESPQRFEMLVAYTNRSDRLLVAAAPAEVRTPEKFVEKIGVARLGMTPLSGVDPASAALILEPGETRVARYAIERLAEPPPRGGSPRPARPYALTYHRRDPDGQFYRGEALLFAPGSEQVRLAGQPSSSVEPPRRN